MKYTTISTVTTAGLLATGVTGNPFPNCDDSILAQTAACDPAAAPPTRAAAVVAVMNITEKLTNLVEYVTLPSVKPTSTDIPSVVAVWAQQESVYHHTTGGTRLYTG